MTAFGADRAVDVLAQCQRAGEAIGNAFSQAMGGDFQVNGTAATRLEPTNYQQVQGAGFVFRFDVDDTHCLAVLAKTAGALPAWCTEPDDDSRPKFHQLGFALATAMFPPGTDCQVADVAFHEDLAAAVGETQPLESSAGVALEIATDDTTLGLILIWPVGDVDDAAQSDSQSFQRARESGATSDSTETQAAGDSRHANGAKPPRAVGPAKLPKHRRLIYRNLDEGIRQLPAYAQSLLRVQVPVTVTLATAKTPVNKILAMGPGTILQFKKACDSKLTLEVGRQTVAEGEAVKVGDKFGLWITSMTMPGERFWSVGKSAMTKRVR